MNAATIDSRRAWTIAACAALANVAVFGVMNSFGVFFEAMADEFGAGSGATAAVFAVTLFLYFTLGAVTGPIADRVGPRPLLIAGAILAPAGLLLTAASNSIWMAYAASGAGLGAGAACVYVPMLAAVGGWFERQRTAALGLATTGIALGTMIASPLSAALIDRIGFRETYVVYATAVFATLMLCATIVDRPPARAARRPEVRTLAAARDLAADPSFARLYLSGTLMAMVVFVPLVFLASYASDHGAGDIEAATLVGLMGGASVVGRLAVGAFASRVDLLGLYRTFFAAIAGALLLWLSAGGDVVALVAFAVIYGAAYGAWVALLPAVAALLFGSERMGVTLGLLFTSGAIGALLGVPLAGATIDATGDYEAAIAVAFGLAALSWLIVRGIGSTAPAAERVIEPVIEPAVKPA